MNNNRLPNIELDLPTSFKNKNNPRIIVAMSGGVDSSVAAALVAASGYETVGITLQLYDHGAAVARKGACCAGQDIHDARQVAAQLGIAHYVLDYESRFRESVIDDFADSYLAGHTPIPCIRCNETVKFRDLLQTARELGGAALVTGHYIASTQNADGHWVMQRPRDLTRDQSYFLFSTTQEQLEYLRFPLAAFHKNEIREFAEYLGLKIAQKPDSQDICFVPNGDYAGVIKKLRPDASLPGDIVDKQGRVLGQHQGVIHYTVGQRRGLGIAAGDPLYVIRIDAAARHVVVGDREDLAVRHIDLEDVNWLGSTGDQELRVRVRSTGALIPAHVDILDDRKARVYLRQPEDGVSPGQACVFYGSSDNRVLGGGWIRAVMA